MLVSVQLFIFVTYYQYLLKDNTPTQVIKGLFRINPINVLNYSQQQKKIPLLAWQFQVKNIISTNPSKCCLTETWNLQIEKVHISNHLAWKVSPFKNLLRLYSRYINFIYSLLWQIKKE